MSLLINVMHSNAIPILFYLDFISLKNKLLATNFWTVVYVSDAFQ